MRSLRLNNIKFEVENFNSDFLLLKTSKPERLRKLGKAILDINFDFIDEVISTETEIYIQLNKNYKEEKLSDLEQISILLDESSRVITIPVVTQVDSSTSAALKDKDIAIETYLSELEEAEFDIAMFGFIPGFVYLNGLAKGLQLPRKENPSLRIPKNSLAVGGKYIGIYSQASPGGWRVLGQLIFPIYNSEGIPPLHLDPNDKLRFQFLNKQKAEVIKKEFSNLLHFNGLT